jgi:aspartyl-tRNA(Asn)/glutamyl-tRNA(Gln) amidotransferase subunit B
LLVTPVQMAAMLELVDKGVISGKIAKSVFEEMLESGKDPEAIVKDGGITQISDEEELARHIEEAIRENPASVEDYRKGKEKALGFLVGQVMRKTGGRANPQVVNEMLRSSLEEKA